jgi:hypothetical protein
VDDASSMGTNLVSSETVKSENNAYSSSSVTFPVVHRCLFVFPSSLEIRTITASLPMRCGNQTSALLARNIKGRMEI